ncbi:hypothetical protein ACP4OV_022114 [Aristida adscensionis]
MRTGGLRVRGRGGAGAAEERGLPPLVLLRCIGAIALLASSARTSFRKDQVCLGSSWCVSWAPVAQIYSAKSQGVKYELQTLPVDARAVTDGDTITVYVEIADHLESVNVPRVVHKEVVDRAKAWAGKNFLGADAQTQMFWIRLRGLDAPESLMPYGKEAKEGLAKLVQGKSLKVSVYDTDRYGRLVGDVDCDGIFVQEYMLKNGLAWHYTAYDNREELTKWENQAKVSQTGLWSLMDPEKPWEWRKRRRISYEFQP